MVNSSFSVSAPAKINLHLAVKNKRKDGFHDIDSIFLKTDFADTLHFEPVSVKNHAEIIMKWEPSSLISEDIPAEKNIIYKALSLFREKTGFEQGFKIIAEKRIPAGGGLGGGSSNAATVLSALNDFLSLEDTALFEMATSLGSDVPFFLHKTNAARVTGRGECIEPLDLPCMHFVLVNPGFKSDTAAAFKLLDEYRKTSDEIKNKDITSLNYLHFCNDFLPVFNEREKSIYKKIISRLQELGAEYANLSGAGSTCFGVFKEKAKAEEAAVTLNGEWSFVRTASMSAQRQ